MAECGERDGSSTTAYQVVETGVEWSGGVEGAAVSSTSDTSAVRSHIPVHQPSILCLQT